MRPRRIVVCTLADASVATTKAPTTASVSLSASPALPTAAALHQQCRSVMWQSWPALAPRRGRSSAQTNSAGRGALGTFVPGQTTPARRDTARPPSSEPKSRQLATEKAQQQQHVEDVPPRQTVEDEAADVATAAGNNDGGTSPACLMSGPERDVKRSQERLRLTKLRYRLLVGAHCAMRSTVGVDCRVEAPRLAFERTEGASSSADPTAGNREAEGSLLVGLAKLSVKLPSSSQRTHCGAASAPSATAELSVTEALRLFANTFALTLHSTPQQWRSRVSAATAPALPVFVGSSSMPVAGPPLASSFLCSPLAIVAAPVAVGSVTQRAIAFKDTAPLRWLEASFLDLCERLLRELYDGYAGATRPQDLFAKVQDEAVAVLRAIDKDCRAVNNHLLYVMRGQHRRDAAAAAASGSSRKRKPLRESKDATVDDTFQNTLERVGQQLHLVHVWVIHLCCSAAEGGAGAAAVCVAQRALRWNTLCTAVAASTATLDDVRWLFAVAMLEHLHTQTYCFHHAKTAAVGRASDAEAAADGGKSRTTSVVLEAHHLRGLAALIDFAMTQRLEVPLQLATHLYSLRGEALSSAIVAQQEALLDLIVVYHALLPTYALLLPLYHRAFTVAETPSVTLAKRRYALGEAGSVAPVELALDDNEAGADANQVPPQQQTTAATMESCVGKEDEDDGDSNAVRKLSDRRAAAASPLRVWDTLIQHWEQEQEHVRSEGAAAAVWWLRMLPLWISTVTAALQLRIIIVSSSGEGAGTPRTTEPMKVLVDRAAAVLRDALRFDRREYERSRGVQQLLTLRSACPRGDAPPLGDKEAASNDSEADKNGESGGSATSAAEVARRMEALDALDDADGLGANAPPPLRRQRGKRSLFYKSPHEAEGGVLVRENQAKSARGSCSEIDSSTRSRFQSRSRVGAGFAARSASLIPGAFGSSRSGDDGDAAGAVHLRHGRTVSASAAADGKTSPIFQAVVLSRESPVILSNLFRLGVVRRRSCFEEAWAATVHAQNELWRLLYALPPAAGAASEAATLEKFDRVALLRNALPAAVASLVGTAAVVAPSGTGDSSQRRAAATSSSASSSAETSAQEEMLRRVLCALQSAQEQLGLSLLESLHHLLASVAQVLLRIDHMNGIAPGSLRAPQECTAGKQAPLEHVLQRQAFAHVLTIGATILLTGNSLSWESAQVAWQLQLQQLRYPQVEFQAGAAVPQLPRARLVSVPMDDFAVQWTKTIVKDLSLLHVSCRQCADVVLDNALEMLRVLQTPSVSEALPLFAKQVTMVALLRSLSALAGQWRQRRDATQKGFRVHKVAGLAEVSHAGVMRLYQGVLDLLRDDGALRLLCCYATFLGDLFEIHVRLKTGLAPLMEWADMHLLPTVLPVVLAGLHRSQSTHSAATHADVCEATLGLLSQLSRYAANPQMSLMDVVRTKWNQALLHVSLYCIRTARRGGRKRAPDYGLPPPVLPSLDDSAALPPQRHGADAAATVAVAARQWVEAFTGGREPVFLTLLDHSEALLGAAREVQSRTIEAAEGTTSALAAYIAAWDERVRFSGRDWDTVRSATREGAVDDSTGDTRELLAHLQVTYEEVQAFGTIISPALCASAEATPFMASKPNNTHQLGFLVRFMEQHLRVQERLSRLSDDELESFMLPWRAKDEAVSSAVPRPSSPSPSPGLAASAATVGETAPLVLLDFVGYLSSRSVWAMVTWAYNIAETVVKIELKRHRHIPEAVQAVATTAILSQLRTVPPPLRGAGKPPVNILRALLGLSDIVAGATESILGYHRRSMIRGMLSNPTRDQYRVVTFGLKQATAYVQEEARQYQGLRARENGECDEGASAMDAGDTEAALEEAAKIEELEVAQSADGVLHFRTNADGTIDRTWLAADAPGIPAPPRQLNVGIYYVKVWAAYAAQQRLCAATGKAATGEATVTASTLMPYLRTDLNREYRFFVSCLVCLADASMESVLLQLRRLQGDGEEDIRLLVEAAVSELCSTVSATIHSLLSLSPEMRRACCQREEAELLWASLCIVATISAVVPRDPQERFFTPRCTDAIGRVFSLTRRLVGDAISIMATPTPATGEANLSKVRDSSAAATSEPGGSPMCRPLCTALVRGVQLLMRDPHSSQRMAIRLAVRQRERDDLSAVLMALQVLVKSAAAYEPGRSLLHDVWAQIAAELCQPLPDPAAVAAAPSATRSEKSKKAKLFAAAALSGAAPTELKVAATVISRSEYSAVLRGLASACAAPTFSSVRDGKPRGDDKGDGSAESDVALPAGRGSGVLEAGSVVCDVAAAVRHVVEDAAGIEEVRRRCLSQTASEEEWHCAGVPTSDGAASPGVGRSLTSPQPLHMSQAVASGPPAFSVAEVMESNAMPTTAIVDAVITHAAATVRAAGGRSSLDIPPITDLERIGSTAAGAADGVEDDPTMAVGFLRLVREFQLHVTELLSLVPLRDIVSRPQAEVLFACLGLLHGAVSAAAEDRVWALMTSKWISELLAPSEPTFLKLQELELARVREVRALTSPDSRSGAETHFRGDADGTVQGSNSSSSSPYGPLPWGAAVVDMFAAGARAPTAGSAQTNDELSVLAAAEHSMRHHWCAEGFDLPRHDDLLCVLGTAGGVRKGPRNADKERSGGQQSEDCASSLVLDPQATGLAALAAMPDPIPIPVVLTILKLLSRHPVEEAVMGPVPELAQTLDRNAGGRTADQVATAASWLAKGGSDGCSVDGASGQGVKAVRNCFTAFAEAFLTYTARAYWLLRPRLGDSAWVVLGIMEKSMAAYPTDNGVRQREWDRVCRQWRLPVSLDHAHAVAGQFFTKEQRRHIKAWTTALDMAASGEGASAPVSTKTVDDAEEVAVLRYLQAAALYLHLLARTLFLLSRLGIFGDLPMASIEVVRRRVQAQVLQHRSPGDRGTAANSIVPKEVLTRELARMALERQTQPPFVNRNLFEGAVLQLLNVVWCVVRHADSLTHTATDVVVRRLQTLNSTASMGPAAPSLPRAQQTATAEAAAIVSYTDHLRTMIVGIVQDTLDMVTSLGNRAPNMLPQHAVKTLLTSGFSCEPLTLRLPTQRTQSPTATPASSMHSGKSAARRGRTSNSMFAPAVSVIATHLSTTGVPSSMVFDATLISAPASAAASLSATPELAVSSAFNPVARPELFVGSPTMLTILSPQFVRSTICRSLESNVTSPTLLPVAFALEFYLSRHGVPLAPLLEATTELLTACTLRNSAVHMYCERLASELTSRKEFRQALAPPTIASVEQGAAGSISNEIVISFLAAIARRDVLVTKKTLAHLLHSVMRMRPDVFGHPPTEDRQGKLTLVQVGTTVDSAIDTTNPLYTPAQPTAKRGRSASAAGQSGSAPGDNSDTDGPRDSAAVMNAFNLERWSDATAVTHRKALAALTISLPTVIEVAMHMDCMRPLDSSERRRAIKMLKAADEARRERVAAHRSQVQAAIQQGHAGNEQEGEDRDDKKGQCAHLTAAAAGNLDASLHLEDPFDFGVGVLHLRYALRKIVHASLRRLLHQQGPHMLAEVAVMLQMVDPALQRTTATAQASSAAGSRGGGGRDRRTLSSSRAHGASVRGAGHSAEQPRPFDGVLAGTTRVLLSRAVLCAQAIGYDSTGAVLEMSPRNGSSKSQEAQPVLKLPVPALQPSVVEAAISATASAAAPHLRKGRHMQAGHSTGKLGQLSKEEKATVHQRVELERDAATTVGLTTAQLPPQSMRRIARALRFTRRHLDMRRRRREYRNRQETRPAEPCKSTSAASHPASRGYAPLSEAHGSR
ncbi:hypothetical protein GH5_06226 [Leishmania sp. Ghana 2012 LV757]|uniref:hypothetical protein n=1 Tax=Leishmania sp. Ghana 2012 LV757 TaxID=2803181 RepID=UPI001B6B1786|nr:hypothetical protein GH5_06226 [Leishmania sp. Ghana 2012 LV757]